MANAREEFQRMAEQAFQCRTPDGGIFQALVRLPPRLSLVQIGLTLTSG